MPIPRNGMRAAAGTDHERYCAMLRSAIKPWPFDSVSETVMWVSIFVAMPVVFGMLSFAYLAKTRCDAADARSQMTPLIVLWIGLSFGCDALVYIGVVPLATGATPNWRSRFIA